MKRRPPSAVTPVRLAVTSIAPGGDAVAHIEQEGGAGDPVRRAVFIAGAAPGDVIDARVDFSSKPARAREFVIVEPSPERVVPPCPVAGKCGGCDLMHLSIPAQIRAHVAMLQASLGRVVSDLPPVVVHAATKTERYRTRARLAIVTTARGVEIGYRPPSSHAVLNIRACLVLDPALEGVLADLPAILAGERGSGEATIAVGRDSRPAVVLAWKGELSGAVFGRFQAYVDQGRWAGVEVRLEGATAPARIGDARAHAVGADGEPLVVPPAGFAQADQRQNAVLGRRVAELLGPTPDESLTELFAGSGNFSVVLSRLVSSLTTVELEAAAVEAARANLAARGLSAHLVCADADTFDLPPRTRLVVLDPPRAGAPGAAARIAASRVRRVAYVSCNPATLARDAATLAGAGFTVQNLETVEMFPHTSHVEVIALFVRSAAR